MTLSEAGGVLKKLGEDLLKTRGILYPKMFGSEFEIQPPENLNVEVEYKEKNDKKKFEVELEWYDGSAMKDMSKTERSLEFKKLKKELKHALYDVEVALKSDDLTAAKDNFSRFIDLERKCERYSEPEWEDNIKGQNKIMKDIEDSLNRGDADDSLALVEKLWKYKKACHARFKN